jgi:hypothetical protein
MKDQFRIGNIVQDVYSETLETVVEVLSSYGDFPGAVIKTATGVEFLESYWNIEDPETVEELGVTITEQDLFDLGFTVDGVVVDYLKEIRSKVWLGFDKKYSALWIVDATSTDRMRTILLKDNLKLHQLQNLTADLI